jgi:pimeloyl-ACP methyl ester carboxylesterase
MNVQRRKFFSAVLTVAVAASLTASTGATAASPGVETGLIKVGDANIEYFSQGQGQAVVLLPGGSLTVGYMDGLAKALADAGYRAVQINFRGAGKSEGPAMGVTLHTLAADVAGVIEALNLGPANVAGHAFGNRVARMLDADRPELVHSVILLAAGGKVEPKPPVQRALRTIFNPASSKGTH